MDHDATDPDVLAEFYAYLRYDVLRVDIVTDDETGDDYLQDRIDDDTGEEWVPDAETIRRFVDQVGQHYKRLFLAACPRAAVQVVHGERFSVTFTQESPVRATDAEIWNACGAFDAPAWDDMWSCALRDALAPVTQPRLRRATAAPRRRIRRS